mmetsp:Transcript_104290/g.294090  ORF Transcript_104290/g.294090 Transcript_104290/m.294090 type:complete len:84 (+) Transcript_104290:358-609(+)
MLVENVMKLLVFSEAVNAKLSSGGSNGCMRLSWGWGAQGPPLSVVITGTRTRIDGIIAAPNAAGESSIAVGGRVRNVGNLNDV